MGKSIITNASWFTYIFPIYRCGDFLAGCSLGYLFRQKVYRKNISGFKASLYEIVAVVVLLFCYFLPEIFEISASVQNTVRFIPGVSMLIWVLAKNEGRLAKILSKKILVEIGNISGYTFLIHQVVINTIASFGVNEFIVASVALVVTFALAYVYKKLKKLKIMNLV